MMKVMANLANNHEEYLTPDAQFVPVEITSNILQEPSGAEEAIGEGPGVTPGGGI